MFAYFFSVGPTEWVVVVAILAGHILPAWLAWRVSEKASFPGPMGLLVVIPLGIIVFLFVLAFRPWPKMSAQPRAT